MGGDGGLVHRAHTYGAGAEGGGHADLGRGLVARAQAAEEHAAPQRDAGTARRRDQLERQRLVVDARHRATAAALHQLLRREESALADRIDVVRGEHQVAGLELRVDAADRVREDERVGAERSHHANAEGHLVERVAFVAMAAPGQNGDRRATPPKNLPARSTCRCRFPESPGHPASMADVMPR